MSLILSGTDGLSDIDGTAATPAIRGTDANTGIFFPAADTIAFSEGGAEAMRIDSAGNVGIGSTPTAIGAYKVLEVNGTSGAYIALKQGGTEYGNIYNNSTDGTTISASGARNIIFQTNAAERMRIDSSGNVLVTNVAGLGYGTGSGGTVTQATSKSTAVTLNKPTGVITMNNAALADATTVGFACFNSVAAATDTVVLTPLTSTIDMSFYQWGAAMNGAGNIRIYLRNISGGSRSEAVVFNFAIIKGSSS